ncbi:MAG: molybdopterin biosynthesis protein [Anaerolineae bacterium UTCFX2]|jgi:putative molybdopterin biosynthesis protein|nr:molybdopterin biosynthesis protein [Anaerolineae bacterium]MCZ7551678.1 molybdopterin biosynthesis protein [Anaerolineales bacterium]OQY91735.1 MAG: molybdopterin biosynthesis protein [Anaerolineae bacterium UTCFX2]
MSIYLHDISLDEAQARLEQALRERGLFECLGSEPIPLDEAAAGRVLAEPVWAKISSPNYHASAMDGFALQASATAGAQPNQPVILKCGGLGDQPPQTVYVDTGDPVPGWADAVIPIENVEALDEREEPAADPRRPAAIRLRAAVTPWSNIRALGEDIVASQLVLPAGHTLRPVDLGAIGACGHTQVQVTRKPYVAILPTGSELVPLGQAAKPGDIIEYNSLMLAGQVNEWGGQATRFPIIPDDFDEICAQVRRAASEHDLILLNAGASAGSEDFSSRVVESLGELLVHGVAVRPGHPVILGMIERASDAAGGRTAFAPIIGVPGYPVSAALTAEIFVEPLIARWLGRPPRDPIRVQAALTRKATSPAGDDDYVRMAAGYVGDRLLAAPLARGSGMITSLVRADGITIIPRGSQGLPAGAPVEVRLYRSPNDLKRTIFAIGSHDMTLDLMAQFLAQRNRRLASANVGSMGGLIALQRGEAHLAGSHLLDPETGSYNLKFIRETLPGVAVKVVSLVGRQQGLLVAKGNPKRIQRLEDLSRPDVRFINRQRGAGTRVLLDYHLTLLSIAPQAIQGYNQEEFTHLAVAAAVASGRADCGLGIAAAAQALELDFIPLFNENYELIIPSRFYEDALLRPLLDLLTEAQFQRAVASLPGYEVSHMGALVAEVS